MTIIYMYLDIETKRTVEGTKVEKKRKEMNRYLEEIGLATNSNNSDTFLAAYDKVGRELRTDFIDLSPSEIKAIEDKISKKQENKKDLNSADDKKAEKARIAKCTYLISKAAEERAIPIVEGVGRKAKMPTSSAAVSDEKKVESDRQIKQESTAPMTVGTDADPTPRRPAILRDGWTSQPAH